MLYIYLSASQCPFEHNCKENSDLFLLLVSHQNNDRQIFNCLVQKSRKMSSGLYFRGSSINLMAWYGLSSTEVVYAIFTMWIAWWIRFSIKKYWRKIDSSTKRMIFRYLRMYFHAWLSPFHKQRHRTLNYVENKYLPWSGNPLHLNLIENTWEFLKWKVSKKHKKKEEKLDRSFV